MLPTLRFFMRLVDLEEEFERHGFEKKVGITPLFPRLV
jgi:hypothetical protein